MDEVLKEIIQPAGWQALTLAGIGLLLLILASIISRVEKNRRIKRSEAETQIQR